MNQGKTENKGKILLIEDEEPVRETTKTMLELAGYTVISAEDGVDAIRKYDEGIDHLDLVLLDLTMPRMSGKETLNKLIERDPDMKVIIASGLDVEGPASELLSLGASSAIQKPYRMSQLLDSVAKVMSTRDPGERDNRQIPQ